MKHTIRYVGDLHGRNEHFAIHDDGARDAGIRHVVQCGDLGVRYAPSFAEDPEAWRRFRDTSGEPVPRDNILERPRDPLSHGPVAAPSKVTVAGEKLDPWETLGRHFPAELVEVDQRDVSMLLRDSPNGFVECRTAPALRSKLCGLL